MFFRIAWADELSLEFEWQQVTSGPEDSSEYSDRSEQSQQWYNLDGVDSFSYRQLIKNSFRSFGKRSKCTNYN